MQTMRKAWIDEGKPRDRDEERRWEAVKAHDAKLHDNGNVNPEPRIRESSVPTAKAVQSGAIMSGALNSEPQDESLFVSDNDEMDGSIPQISAPKTGVTQTEQTAQKNSTLDESLFFSDDEAPKVPAAEELDDLDALLAEDEQRQDDSRGEPVPNPAKTNGPSPDEFDDEMEAMAGFDEW